MGVADLSRVVSPIHVAHRLIAEVFFSVYSEMDTGEKMPSPGPGGLRVMRITRDVSVPSVGLETIGSLRILNGISR